jgi:hypothetical protein
MYDTIYHVVIYSLDKLLVGIWSRVPAECYDALSFALLKFGTHIIQKYIFCLYIV